MIKVIGHCLCAAEEDKGIVLFRRTYTEPTGLACKQTRTVQYESDFANGEEYRISYDNGRTWGEWQESARTNYFVRYGEDEVSRENGSYEIEFWNPVHNHFVGCMMTRYYMNGHEEAYKAWWSEGALTFFDHQYLFVRRPSEDKPYRCDLIQYEDGALFDSENPRNPEYLYKNRGYINHPIVLSNGDIAIPVGVPVETCCRMAGVDVKRVFPSRPKIFLGVVVAIGHFNPETQGYNFSFSNPIILDDLRSARGIDEPQLVELKSGRLLLVMRGSNAMSKGWETRVEKGTPSFKWYAWSDDGGTTFTEVYPWHFDDGEVIYSSATISQFVRHGKNGKLYWIGNITDYTAYGNDPRYPLQIVEVDENTGTAIKGSLTIIDTRREGESEEVQLSNFHVLENRETGKLELTLCKYGQYDASKPFFGESWLYEIDLG